MRSAAASISYDAAACTIQLRIRSSIWQGVPVKTQTSHSAPRPHASLERALRRTSRGVAASQVIINLYHPRRNLSLGSRGGRDHQSLSHSAVGSGKCMLWWHLLAAGGMHQPIALLVIAIA